MGEKKIDKFFKIRLKKAQVESWRGFLKTSLKKGI